ncbi:hypothetical protein [Methanospirillum lacunae]|nr:hypothetical protein [Methanospirillum lacunae]
MIEERIKEVTTKKPPAGESYPDVNGSIIADFLVYVVICAE